MYKGEFEFKVCYESDKYPLIYEYLFAWNETKLLSCYRVTWKLLSDNCSSAFYGLKSNSTTAIALLYLRHNDDHRRHINVLLYYVFYFCTWNYIIQYSNGAHVSVSLIEHA